MILTPQQQAIIEFSCEKFKNRHGRICFIGWLPAEWCNDEINSALEGMLHHGIIKSPSNESTGFMDGFVLNMP